MEEAIVAVREAQGEVSSALRVVADGARSDHGRYCLAELEAVPALLSYSRSSIDDNLLLPLLRALRNLCAGEPRNQQAFVASTGMDLAASLALKFHKRLCNEEQDGMDCLKALLQLLGNVVGSGEQAQVSLWKAFFPEILLNLACVSTEEAHEPLCMVLFTCSRSSHERRCQLVQGKGSHLLALLLRNSQNPGEENDNQWLNFLVEALCLKDQLLPTLFESLGPVDKRIFSSEQAILLGMIHSVLDDCQEDSGLLSRTSIDFFADIIEESALLVASSVSEKGTPWPTGLPSSDILGYSLLISRLVSTPENVSRSLAGIDRMLRTLLAMLRALGPPAMVKKAMGNTVAEEQASPTEFPVCNVYKGYRRDIVSVIANSAYHSSHVQDQVRENEGLLLVLQQCVVDEDNPYLREWGLWAIRNLTEGNAKNIEELSNLELKKPINVLEGLEVEVDEMTKRPKLVNKSASSTAEG